MADPDMRRGAHRNAEGKEGVSHPWHSAQVLSKGAHHRFFEFAGDVFYARVKVVGAERHPKDPKDQNIVWWGSMIKPNIGIVSSYWAGHVNVYKCYFCFLLLLHERRNLTPPKKTSCEFCWLVIAFDLR